MQQPFALVRTRTSPEVWYANPVKVTDVYYLDKVFTYWGIRLVLPPNHKGIFKSIQIGKSMRQKLVDGSNMPIIKPTIPFQLLHILSLNLSKREKMRMDAHVTPDEKNCDGWKTCVAPYTCDLLCPSAHSHSTAVHVSSSGAHNYYRFQSRSLSSPTMQCNPYWKFSLLWGANYY